MERGSVLEALQTVASVEAEAQKKIRDAAEENKQTVDELKQQQSESAMAIARAYEEARGSQQPDDEAEARLGKLIEEFFRAASA